MRYDVRSGEARLVGSEQHGDNEWLTEVKAQNARSGLSMRLDLGEATSLVKTESLGAYFVTDDQGAFRLGQERGIAVASTWDLLRAMASPFRNSSDPAMNEKASVYWEALEAIRFARVFESDQRNHNHPANDLFNGTKAEFMLPDTGLEPLPALDALNGQSLA